MLTNRNEDPRRYRIAHFGTFDIESLGDSMFARVLKTELNKRFNDPDITLFSLNEIEKPYNDNSHVYSYRQFDEINRTAPFDALIIGGGELLNFSRIEVTDQEGNPFSYEPAEVWAEPIRMAQQNGIPVLINCIGIIDDFTPDQAAFLCEYLPHASYISVRDRFSKMRIDGVCQKNKEAVEICDNHWMFNIHYPAAELAGIREKLAPELGLDLASPYTILQYGTTYGYKEVSAAAKRIKKACKTTVVLLPVNYCHEDMEALHLIGEEMKDECLLVDKKLQPVEMMSIIAGASVFMGTTLHGSLTALSYHVKTLVLDMYHMYVSKMEGLLDHLNLMDYLVPDPAGIFCKYEKLMADGHYWDTADIVIPEFQARLSDHFDRMAEIIRLGEPSEGSDVLSRFSPAAVNAERRRIVVKAYLTVGTAGSVKEMTMSISERKDGSYSFRFPLGEICQGDEISFTYTCRVPARFKIFSAVLGETPVLFLPLDAVAVENGYLEFGYPFAKFSCKAGNSLPAGTEMIVSADIVELSEKGQISVMTGQLRNQTAWIHSLILSERNLGAELNRKEGHVNYMIGRERTLENEKRILELEKANQESVIAHLACERDELIDRVHDGEECIRNQEERITNQEERISDLLTVQAAQKNRIDFLYENESVLEDIIANRDAHIEQLLETERRKNNELNLIYHSRSYRIMASFRKIAYLFVPPGSKRRMFAALFLKALRHPVRYMKKLNPKSIGNFRKALKEDGVEGVNVKISNMEVIEDGIPMKPLMLVNMKSEKFPKLVFPIYKNPAVSIVIPVYNQFSYTYGCLKAVLMQTDNVEYEIILADDCSTDMTSDIASYAENITVSRTAGNLGFLKNCNQAASEAKGRYIVFLNNDTNVQREWLSSLVGLMEPDKEIGMAGSKLVYPDGKLQEAGGILWNDGSAWNYGHGKNPEAPEYNYVKDADYISGAGIMIRKELWQEIGGFDERYAPAYCEDSDLAFEVRKRGFRVVYQPLSIIVHYEGISNGRDLSSGMKAYQVENSRKFFEKWEKELTEFGFPNGQNVFDARDRSRNKPTLLMIDHYVPQFDRDAGSRTVYQYLKLFLSRGFNVKFIGDNYFRHEPYCTALQQMGIEVLYGPYYAKEWKKWIKTNAECFDFVFINRPHITQKYVDFIKFNTSARILYYGHDLHFLRETREYELNHNPETLEAANEWKKKEFEIMKKVDRIYYPSEIEVKEIAAVDPSVHAKAIPAYLFENIETVRYEAGERRDIMFVGGFAHRPNVDAVLWLASEIFPRVQELSPDLTIYILGSNPPPEIKALHSEHFVIKGFVSDEELIRMYRSTRFSVVPLRYGAGIKGKVIESMYYGCPVMTTSVGAEGIPDAGDVMVIEDDPSCFAGHLVELYENGKELKRLSESYSEYIRSNYTPEKAWEIVGPDFAGRI